MQNYNKVLGIFLIMISFPLLLVSIGYMIAYEPFNFFSVLWKMYKYMFPIYISVGLGSLGFYFLDKKTASKKSS